jgi:molecular chaperone DnaK
MGPDQHEIWGRWAAAADRPERPDRPELPEGDERKDTPVTDYSNIPREATRVPLAHRIQLKFDRFSGFINEYVSNISPGGIFIRTDAPERPGQLLEFEFRLGDGYELIHGRGEVVWARERSDGPERPPGMGVRFIELSPGSKDLIYKIVDDYVAHGGKPFDLTPPAAAAAAARGGLAPAPATGTGAAPAPPPAAAPAAPLLPWTLDIPAIQPLPGVPAITPRSPLESLGTPAATPGSSGAGVAETPGTPGAAGDPAMPATRKLAGEQASAATGRAGTPEPTGEQAAADQAGIPAAAGEQAGGPSSGSASGGEAMDPLVQMAAALPPLDELAPDVPVLLPPVAAVPEPSPAPIFVSPATPMSETQAAPMLGPATPMSGAPAAPTSGAPGAAVPGAPAAPLFSSFDLRARRRRSRLPLVAALVAVSLLALAVWLLRDTAVAWFEKREAVQPAENASAPAAMPGAPAPPAAAPRVPPSRLAAAPAPATPASAAPGTPAAAPGAPSAAPARQAGVPPAAIPPAALPPGGSAAAAPKASSAAATAAATPAPRAAAPATPAGTAAAGAPPAPKPAATPPDRSAATRAASPGPRAPLVPLAAAGSPAAAASPSPPASTSGSAASAAASLPAAAGAPAAGRATAIERISWEAKDGTVVVLWGNGDFPSQSYTRVRVSGLPAREVIRISGIDRPFPSSRLAVRTQELMQIRTGYHPPKDLHVVLDLGGRDVQVTDIEPGPRQLRIHLRSR